MENISCKTKDEKAHIIEALQNRNPNLSADLILRAIQSCCLTSKDKEHDNFLECVNERVKMLKVI